MYPFSPCCDSIYVEMDDESSSEPTRSTRSALLPGEHRLLQLVDPIVAALQAEPAQLQQHSACRCVDQVVTQWYLHNRPWAFRDGDESGRVIALQLMQPDPVDRDDLVGRRPRVEPSAAPDHHRGDDVSGSSRIVVEQAQHGRIDQL